MVTAQIKANFRQTGECHLAVVCNVRCEQPLDARPLLAENRPLIGAVSMVYSKS